MNEINFCEKVIAPGIVVLLNGKHQPTWGVTIPYKYWWEKSGSDSIARFENYSSPSHPQIPCLEFVNEGDWRIRFYSFPKDMKPLCWLYDFEQSNLDFGAVPMVMRACSCRDGGRYYRELYSELAWLARGASREFTSEELKWEVVGVQELIKHARAIRAWKKENIVWKNTWKSPYEPGHRLHFDLL